MSMIRISGPGRNDMKRMDYSFYAVAGLLPAGSSPTIYPFRCPRLPPTSPPIPSVREIGLSQPGNMIPQRAPALMVRLSPQSPSIGR